MLKRMAAFFLLAASVIGLAYSIVPASAHADRLLGSSGSSPTRRYPTDSNDSMIYTLDDSAAPVVNSGTAGSTGNLDTLTANAVLSWPSLFTNGIQFNGSNTAAYRAGTSTISPAAPVSVFAWVMPLSNAIAASNIAGKTYKDPVSGGWVAPVVTLGVGVDINQHPTCAFTTGSNGAGVTITSVAPTSCKVVLGIWNHVGCSFDGSFQNIFLNGIRCGSPVANSGTLDYNTNGGNWFIGNPPATSPANGMVMIVDEVRVSTVARDSTYAIAVWQAGIGIY